MPLRITIQREEQPMDELQHGSWYALLDPRQQATTDHAITYALNYAHAGVPGHSAHLLIAKLADLLDRVEHDANSNQPPWVTHGT